jgi:STE24 endopeptidase
MRLQIHVLIAFFIVLASVGLVDETATNPDHWTHQFSTKQTMLLIAGSILIFFAIIRFLVQRLLLRLNRCGWQDRSAMRLPGKCDLIIQYFLLALFGAQLTYGGWCKLIYLDWNLKQSILLWEILLLMPFLLMMVMKWFLFYPINHFIRTHVVAEQLTDGIAARPVWSRAQYLTFQIRNSLLIVLLPLLLILSFRDISDWVVSNGLAGRDISQNLQESANAIIILIFFLVAPLFLRFIWSTRSLPTGPLREKLEKFCRRLNLKYRDILVWNTYSAVSNAAVMGLIAPVRYVMLSDALIENMPDEQIEAVFGHETGHVKHHHILFLLLFIMGSGSLVVLLSELLAIALEKPILQNAISQGLSHWIFYGTSLLLALGWLSLFGWVSRRFEWQADLYAAQVLDQHDNNNQLGLHGANIVGAALERVTILNGISPYARSWRHSSIANRIARLRHLATQTGAVPKSQRTVTITKTAIILAIIIAITGWYTLPIPT